jgi:NAD(P)-dependent dehydrogenase (short-subunit alcohol dehydrogenase family)
MLQMTQDLFSVQDKVVIVTGGLGQLGRQFSLALVNRGAKVAIFDAQVDEQRVAERFRERYSADNLLFLPVDVTQRDSLAAAFRQVEVTWGIPHGLINNAGLDSPPNAPIEENGPFETYPESSWDKVIQVNVKGVMLGCQLVGGAMAAVGRGSIINICSVYGLVSPDQRIYEYRRVEGEAFYKPVAYSVSKSALLNLTRYLATYWAANNVRVNTLTFGGVFNHQDKQFLKGYCARVPLGRMAREDDYNGAIIYLLSDASAYMTGSNMVIDGGWTAW